MGTGGRLVLHLDAELALQHHHDLERVDRVEAQAAVKERVVIADIVGRHILELEAFDQQLFQFAFQIHSLPWLGSHLENQLNVGQTRELS